LSAAMFAPEHPYHWPTIGSAEDIRDASIDLVREFFQRYYHPANASLSLAGDLETEQAFDLAEAYFGDLPAGPAVDPIRLDARLSASANLVLEDRVELPRLYIAWHSPAMFADDDAELDIVADVLAHGKTSRLYKTLVYERRIATDVSAFQSSREMGGMFQIICTASAGVALTELNTAVLTAVNELAMNGPSDLELERGLAQTEAQFIYRLQTVGGFGGKGDQLNAYNTFAGDPGYFDRDRQRYFDVTARSAAAATARWLVNTPSVTLSVVPRGRRELALSGAAEVQVS
ncbi:MAG TPA: insulinase family protein, partial [Vicinamibacterales bacterium]